MDGGGGRLRRRKSLHQRLGLKSMVCCGSTWGFGIGTSAMTTQNDVVESSHQQIIMSTQDDQNDVVESSHQIGVILTRQDDQNDVVEASHQIRVTLTTQDDENDVVNLTPLETNSGPECTFPSPRMNLADALAAERHFRSGAVTGDDPNDEMVTMTMTEEGTPVRMSLMRLLEEAEMDGQDEGKEGMGRDQMCCVCMGRKKGAAFIPCGHTFCRMCCRELWLNRGSCPLCNRSILEILDIF